MPPSSVPAKRTVSEKDIVNEVTETPPPALPAAAPIAAPVAVPAQVNPKRGKGSHHRPSAHGKGKVWSIKRITSFRRIKLNPFDDSLMKPPAKWGVGSIIAVFPGLAAGQLSLMGADGITVAVASKVGVSSHPWFPVGRDVSRLALGGALGLGVWPKLVSWGLGGKHDDIARGAFVGAAIPWAVDVVLTSIDYARSAASGASRAATSGVGLGALGDLIRGTAQTAHTAETASSAEVAGLGQTDDDLVGQLSAELGKIRELTRLSGVPAHGAIGSSAPDGNLIR